MVAGTTTYKSKVAGLEDNTFDVGAASDPAKFSKLLKKHGELHPEDLQKSRRHGQDTTEYEEGDPQLPDQAKEAGPAML